MRCVKNPPIPKAAREEQPCGDSKWKLAKNFRVKGVWGFLPRTWDGGREVITKKKKGGSSKAPPRGAPESLSSAARAHRGERGKKPI